MCLNNANRTKPIIAITIKNNSKDFKASGFHNLIIFSNMLKELLTYYYLAQAPKFLGQDILRTVNHNEQILCFLT